MSPWGCALAAPIERHPRAGMVSAWSPADRPGGRHGAARVLRAWHCRQRAGYWTQRSLLSAADAGGW